MVFTKKIVVSSGDDNEFNARVLKCIEKVFSSFGDSPKILLYYLLSKDCSLSGNQFVSKSNEFSKCLRKILGDTGYLFTEKLIIAEMEASFEVSIEEGSSLSDAIDQLRGRFLTC